MKDGCWTIKSDDPPLPLQRRGKIHSNMITIYINGIEHKVDEGKNLLDTCLSLGYDIPYFCFHPALGSVGSCRLCAVKRFRDSHDKKGRIIMSCMEPVTDGMIISINDEEVKEFRAAVIESLMTNHPHDCPVCDEGGECHLQDMTVMTGHTYRRYEFKKRTYKNQYLGPYINHEMNRCIQCYRCVRFYKDYAGGKDFGVFGAHNHLYFGRFRDGRLESEFSGNLVEVCPTGVFTDKTLKKHYTRKWDLTNAPSICNNCSVGCNIIIGERYGSIRRILNRYNGEINGYFLCDSGRFGYEFVNAETRIKKSQIKTTGNPGYKELTNDEAIQSVVKLFSSEKTIGIGSPTASIEANFALQQLVGKENFYAGIASNEYSLIKEITNNYQSGKIHVPNLKEVEKAEAVIILGEDILKTAPRLALSVRRSVKNKPLRNIKNINIPAWHDAAVKNILGNTKGPLIIATPEQTGLDDIASVTYRNNPENIAAFGSALLNAITGNPEFPGNLSDLEKQAIVRISDLLKDCNSVTVISGTQSGNKNIIEISFKIAIALSEKNKNTGLYHVVPESNSIGINLMSDKNLNEAVEKIETGSVDTLVILENDLFKRIDKTKLEPALAKCKNIIVLDHSISETSVKAGLVLASGTFAESEGTLVNAEGRMQRYFSALPPAEGICESWKWLADIYAVKNNLPKISFDEIANKIASEIPVFAKIKDVAPGAGFTDNGMKIPRQTKRFSGRTSMLANVNVSEPKPTEDANSALAYSMEGSDNIPPSELTSFYWSPGWNSVQASNKYLKELNNALKGRDPGIRLFK